MQVRKPGIPKRGIFISFPLPPPPLLLPPPCCFIVVLVAVLSVGSCYNVPGGLACLSELKLFELHHFNTVGTMFLQVWYLPAVSICVRAANAINKSDLTLEMANPSRSI